MENRIPYFAMLKLQPLRLIHLIYEKDKLRKSNGIVLWKDSYKDCRFSPNAKENVDRGRRYSGGGYHHGRGM